MEHQDWREYIIHCKVSEKKDKEKSIIVKKSNNVNIDHKMDDKIGSIEIGKEADLIIVEGKPDQNIDDLSNVRQVYISGNRLV